MPTLKRRERRKPFRRGVSVFSRCPPGVDPMGHEPRTTGTLIPLGGRFGNRVSGGVNAG